MRKLLFLLLFPVLVAAQPRPYHNLVFNKLATRWDEAMPLGNGWLGALVWQKENRLRISLARADLWDDRPMPKIDQMTFKWVQEKLRLNQYDSVQQMGDAPYETYPAPTKIPAAALEFDISGFEGVQSNTLDLKSALNKVVFSNKVIVNNYVHAVNNIGYFGFENCSGWNIEPRLSVPQYVKNGVGKTGNSVEGQGLERLGYKAGVIATTNNSIRYRQPTWNNNFYEVLVEWKWFSPGLLIGQWTISVNKAATLPPLNPKLKEPTGWPAHVQWWNNFWNRSSVQLPDTLIETQYYRDMYKFGCVAREHTPPISLQAIWTADNGNLPPWKGDFHHDLNTQLSYWPGYTGNHLNLTASFTNWLWKVREENKRWTKQYFQTPGLNVPGVTTISGKPMGGWIQYSMSPTTSAWLAQHVYWQWKYGMDKNFWRQKGKRYISEVVDFLGTMVLREYAKDSAMKLPLSSSPEYFDNSDKAWFTNFTNYDLALFLYTVYLSAKQLQEVKEGQRPVETDLEQPVFTLPVYDTNETGLTIAPGQNLHESHRHHAHLMAIYPTANLDINNEQDTSIIKKSLRHLEKTGTRKWTGYSFSWAACLYARAKEAEQAEQMLRIFASNFVSPNSFHLNGDQQNGEHSDFTYRPFTLEGNFAFAQGVHELLLQSKEQNEQAYIEVFPAVPKAWKNVSFNNLRAYGAFLVSGIIENGVPAQIKIVAEKGGILKLRFPMRTFIVNRGKKKFETNNGIVEMNTNPGEVITIENGYE